jgi:hypothetical protein
MKNRILLVFLLNLAGVSYSQILFEKGYFINNSDERVECLIKNMEWKNNPVDLEYKLSPDGAIQKILVDDAKEFGIGDSLKFIGVHVNIDRSSENPNEISSESKPVFHDELLFLGTIIEGKASLYFYMNGSLSRFFYKIDNSEIKQLVFKSYLVENANNFSIRDKKIGQNMSFRQQLFNDLKSPALNMKDFEVLGYNKKELKRLFIKYNESTNLSYSVFEEEKKRDWFDFSLDAGLNNSKLDMNNSAGTYIEFENEFSFRFGLEAQITLPFNKNKWSIILEPAYQSYNSKTTTVIEGYTTDGTLVSDIKFQSVQLSTGVRHSFFLDDKSEIFLNAFYVHDFTFNSTVKHVLNNYAPTELNIKPIDCFSLGVGYQFKNRYGLEIRYSTKRELLTDYMYWESNFSTLTVLFKYTLF